MEEAVQAYDSQSEAYHRAFRVFLAHTDQKVNARRWLDELLKNMPARRLAIDAGAGTGEVTALLLEHFTRTAAIEPNPSLVTELKKRCPAATVLPVKILDADPGAEADLVLCSHVLYYIDRRQWMAHARKMASWLAPNGVLVIVLQNHETDCMRMLEAFQGQRFDLSALEKEFAAAHRQEFEVERQTVTAHVTTSDEDAAYVIAEFMLNLLPMKSPPSRAAVQRYMSEHFERHGGGYRFSCHQDFLVIHRRDRSL
jgi:trans-aconitate methyltransferase